MSHPPLLTRVPLEAGLLAGLVLAATPASAAVPPRAPVCDTVPLVGETALASHELPAGEEPSRTGEPSHAAIGVRSASPSLPPPASHHRVAARLDPARHRISARQALTWTNPGPATICSLYLHLDLNAWSGAGSRHLARDDADGASNARGPWSAQHLTRLRQDGQAAVWRTVPPPGGPLTDRTLVRVDLPQPVPPGGRTVLEIRSEAVLPGAWAGMGHSGSFHLAAHWIPQIARMESHAGQTRWVAPAFDPADAIDRGPQSFDVQLTVPRGYIVGAGGVPVGRPALREGVATYRFRRARAQDVPWVADARFLAPLEMQVRPIGALPTGSGLRTPLPAPVRVRVLHRAGQEAAAHAAAQALADAVSRYARNLAPPTGSTVSAVLVARVPPADARALARNGLVVLPGPRRLDRAAEQDLERAALRAMGAAWFTGVGSDPGARALADGLIEYWTARLMTERGRSLQPEGWTRLLRLEGNLDAFEAMRVPLDLRAPALDPQVAAIRTALALHDLEARIGRAAMDRGIRAWLRQGRGDPASLHAALARSSGRPHEVERSFAQHIARQWTVDDRIVSLDTKELLPRPGHVEFRGRTVELTQAAIDRAVERRRDEWRRSGAPADRGPFAWRSTAVVQRRGAAVPQTLLVTFADGSWRRVHWDGREPLRRFEWIARSPAVSAQLDPTRAVLLDESKLDDGRSLRADVAPARRWGGDAAALVQVASALLVGL